MTAQIIHLYVARAHRALLKFRNRAGAVVDTMYGPAPLGLCMAEINALGSAGFGDVRKQREQHVYKVTLTPAGRAARDRQAKERDHG